ncbi:hypothetical protein K438DRAFT_967817 [Mycena galopus ATCC 62051]|nr:hypothetical protein K438DRAFT_967817 [Mycena galopus ATCC 62051]
MSLYWSHHREPQRLLSFETPIPFFAIFELCRRNHDSVGTCRWPSRSTLLLLTSY